jgi:preprotein translocase subunit SecG
MGPVLFHYVIPTIHILACFFLIVVVLLQTGKGADMGAVFGGGSQTLFGSSGAGNFLTRLTTATAIIFMLTSLIMTYGQTPGSSRLLEKLPPPAAQLPTPPVAPETPAAEGGTPTPQPPVAAAPEAVPPAAETPSPTPPAGNAAPAGGTAPAPAGGAAAPAPAGGTAPTPAPAPVAK